MLVALNLKIAIVIVCAPLRRHPIAPCHPSPPATHHLLPPITCCRHDSPGDGLATIQWILQQPWSNGQVYTCGASADGLASFGLAALPAGTFNGTLKAQFQMFAGTSGWPGIVYPGGAYRQGLVDTWLQKTVPDDYPALIQTVKDNEAPGPWWDVLNGTLMFENVEWPTLGWGGWFDIFLQAQIDAFNGFQTASNAVGQHRLFIDPLGHCQAGASYFPRNTILGRAAAPILLALALLTDGNSTATAEGLNTITFFVMGPFNDSSASGPGNYWTTMDTWPAATLTPLYLAPLGSSAGSTPDSPAAVAVRTARAAGHDHAIRFDQAAAATALETLYAGEDAAAVDAAVGRLGVLSQTPPATASNFAFTYNPASPVPTVGGNNLVSRRRVGGWMLRAVDQALARFVCIHSRCSIARAASLGLAV